MQKASVFDKLEIRGITFENRIGLSPMCQYSSVDGFASDYHLMHYGSKSHGTGIMVVEATAIQDIGRITPGCLGLYKDEHVAGHKRVVDYVHNNGSNTKIGIQLGHAGRKASTGEPFSNFPNQFLTIENGGWQSVAPSPIPFKDDWSTPKELSIPEIEEIINVLWPNAIRRAIEAGYDFVEIHGAHGYLIHEFLSPLSNKRTDKYGGSFENRNRFLLETVKKIKEQWNKPLFIRLSAIDAFEGGITIEDTIKLVEQLRDLGVDLVDISCGFNVPAGFRKNMGTPMFNVDLAEEIKKNVSGVLIGTVGGITKPEEIKSIIEEGKADVTFVAREYLRSSEFGLKVHKELGQYVNYPKQYGYAIDPVNHRQTPKNQNKL